MSNFSVHLFLRMYDSPSFDDVLFYNQGLHCIISVYIKQIERYLIVLNPYLFLTLTNVHDSISEEYELTLDDF